MLERQSFFTTVAGLGMSIAGFAALIAWLRDDSSTLATINLWRLKTIVREAFTLVFLALALIPVFSWTLYMIFSGLDAALQLVNIQLASLGILQIGFLLNLLSPVGIFSNFVKELGQRNRCG